MTSVMTVLGARPQFIKAAPVSVALRGAGATEILVHTGQHYDKEMSAQFFAELDLPDPAHNLNAGGGSHAEQTARMLLHLEPLMVQARPDWVLVYGDTNSTLAGALTAAKLGIRIAHVEAGLRSFNRGMPEELNRIVADRLADVLFAPTEAAAANLVREGFPAPKIVRCGDVMFDGALMAKARADGAIIQRLGLPSGSYILATIHRAENTDAPDRLAAIFCGLAMVARTCPVIVPTHPRTRRRLAEAGIEPEPSLRLIEPVGYLDMTALTVNALLVATDSGGLQKEAFFQGVPCVTIRAETEWVELVDSGWNRVVPPNSAKDVADAITEAMAMARPELVPEFYGQGNAAKLIAEYLVEHQ